MFFFPHAPHAEHEVFFFDPILCFKYDTAI